MSIPLLAKLRDIIKPPVLSQRWLKSNATVCDRQDFERDAKAYGAIPIYHVTGFMKAQSIYYIGVIFGIDVVNSAHFHYKPEAATGQAIDTDVVLGFSWSGATRKHDWTSVPSSHRFRSPNVLIDVPVSESDGRTWEVRLYPGSDNLLLQYVQIFGDGFLLRQPREIRVTDGLKT